MAIHQLSMEEWIKLNIGGKNTEYMLRNIHNYLSTIHILFSSNHNIHKSLCGFCFWAADPLIDKFY